MIVGLLIGPVVTGLSLAILVLLVVNLRSMPRLRPGAGRSSSATVSLLVPARDEAETIGACLESLVAQDCGRVEIVVLDDQSTDDTAAIVRSFADRGVRLVQGAPVPDGWTGKNWACDQLARASGGDVLCFVDADTVFDPSAVGAALELLESSRSDLVTLLLAAQHRTVAQATLLPIVNHALMALFPVWMMHRDRPSRVALGIGPFMMVTRSAYDAVGGHAAAPGDIVDDVRLARAIKRSGRRVRLANGTALARTRWYSGFRDICRGFAKNAFGAIDSNYLLAAATVLLLVPLLCLPFVRVALGLVAGEVPTDALAQVALILTSRTATSVAGRDPLWTVPLHPLALVVWGGTLAWSVLLTMTDRTVEWRGRDVSVLARDR